MKRFILHGEMASNFCQEIDLDVKTIREAINGLSSNFPNFRKFFINKSLKGVQYLFVDENKNTMEQYCLDIPLVENSYNIVPSMEGSALAAPFVGNFALGYLMQKFMNDMSPEDDGTPEYEIITTNSFIYSNNENRVEQGTPVPVIYGQLRVGSKVIHSSIHNYDYDHDKAEIFAGNPTPTRISKMAADYTFINSKEIVDYRSQSAGEAFSNYKDSRQDPSKRNSIEVGGNGEKNHSLLGENEPINAGYVNDGSSSNEHVQFGPSENKAVYASANASWWDFPQYNTQPRPFVYPKLGSIDQDMRPRSSNDLSVELLSKDGMTPSAAQKTLAWRNAGSPMKVGSRGDYQKLESIGIYKSLEVLSEGPIAGLAGHITGSVVDNGSVYFPYLATDPAPAPDSISIEPIKYNSFSNSLTSLANNANVGILSAGSYYNNYNGKITGDGSVVNGLSINASKPSNLKSAKIQDIRFKGPDDASSIVYFQGNVATPGAPRYVSSNGLFLMNSGDGSISANTNNLNAINKNLPAKYLNSEATDNGTLPVFSLSNLDSDSELLNEDFRVGSNYGNAQLNYSISPDSSTCQINTTLKKTSAGERKSQAASLDLGVKFKESSLFDSQFENVFNDFKSYTADSNLPWDSSISISKMARIYYDQNGGSDLVDAAGSIRNITISVVIGTYRDTFRSGFNTFNVIRNILASISLTNYLNLGNVTRILSGLRGSASGFTPSYTSLDISPPNGNYFQALCDGSTLSLDYLLRSAAFANNVFNSFNAAMGGNLSSCTLPSFQGRGGGKYIKFGVGSGSNVTQGSMAGSLPIHTVQKNKDNFDSVLIVDSGAVDADDSPNPKGKYHPMIYPRVTVFILRKTVSSGFAQFTFLPTSIDAVAEVSARGTVSNLHLLKVPDNPVYHGGWTPILPHSNKKAPFLLNNSELSYEDLGVFCVIDSSDSSTDCKMYIKNGSVSLSNSRRDSFQGETSWANHIALNGISTTSSTAAGIFSESLDVNSWNNSARQITKDFTIDEVPASFETPTTAAIIRANIESIDISNVANFKKNTLTNSLLGANSMNFICTGRPTSITLQSAGAGYVGKNGNVNGSSITQGIYPQTFTVSRVNILNDLSLNKGYKHNSEFYIHGISSSKNGTVNISPIFYSFKCKVKVDKYGSISDFEIIDGGFGFRGNSSTSDLLLSTNSHLLSYQSAVANSFIPAVDPTRNFDPDNNFAKQDLILTVDAAHLVQGKISKFYVSQIGLGFNYQQICEDPFASVAFRHPVFNVIIQGNSLTSLSIDNTTPALGYGIEDSDITLEFSRPTNRAPAPALNAIDPNAWARSIFLNDVPIRDKNDRFNYSKFHYDIRVGHFKNGNADTHIPSAMLASSAQPMLMSDEFKLPSFTKMVNFVLYGPRNQGEKDYYYAHTIKNPEVSCVSLSFKIEKLHYTYEGDESSLYVNLLPLIAVGLGIMAGVAIKNQLAESLAVADKLNMKSFGQGMTAPVLVCGAPSGVPTKDSMKGEVTTLVPTKDIVKAAKAAAFYASIAGIAGGLVAGMLAKFLINCSAAPWLCFKVGELVKNSGEIWPAKVDFAIEYGVEGEVLKKDVVSFRGCATNPYVKDILIDNLPAAEGSANNFKNRILKVYRLTRELDPVTGGIVEARYQIESSLMSVTEHVAGFFNYNNTALIGTRINSKDHPEIPKKEYLIKGRLLKIPSNYDPTNGTYVGNWDGTFSAGLQWTSNPAWIIYDLLTNERYGMAKYGLKDSDIDIWSFYTFSEFCDERVDAIIDGQARSERRHMCNLYLDSEKQAYDYIRELVKIYNCTINFSAGKLYITIDSSISNSNGSVMIFTNSNVSDEGFSYSSTPETHRVTSATVDYVDERDNYMQKSEHVEDSIGIREHGYSHVKIAGIGVTRRGEAHRLAWHKILTRQLEQEIIQFKTGLQGSYLRIGDVIDVIDNNKISNHSGGRIAKVINANTIEIDVPSSALVNVNEILIQVPVLSDDDVDTSDSSETISRREPQYLNYTISARSNFSLTFSTNLDTDIKQGYAWIIKENTSDKIAPKKYRIKEAKESSPMNFEFTATEYLENKYESIDKSTSSRDGIYIEEREYYGHDIIV
jgi:predicted phage tail protein